MITGEYGYDYLLYYVIIPDYGFVYLISKLPELLIDVFFSFNHFLLNNIR